MAEVISNLGEMIANNISFADVLPTEVANSLGSLIWIFKAVGVVVFIYVIFLIVNSILNIRRGLMIKKTYKIVTGIDEKLDKVLQMRGHGVDRKREHEIVKEEDKNKEKKSEKKRGDIKEKKRK